VWPIGAVAALIVGLCVFRILKSESLAAGSEQKITGVLVLAGVLLWAGLSLPFTSEHIFTDRDPATYNNAAFWLVEHDDLRIPKPELADELEPFGVEARSLGFHQSLINENEIYAQGAHLLPALQALGGRALGFEGALKVNVLIGAVALLAFYGFAQLFVRPRWAAAGTAILAASLPFLVFTRDAYTEPLAMAFLFGGLSLLYYAIKSQKVALWVLAGLVLGASTLVRVDTLIPLAGILVALILLLAVAKKPERKAYLQGIAALAVTTGLMALLAWLDLTQLSSGYYHDLRGHIMGQFKLLGAVGVAGVAVVVLAWRTNVIRKLDAVTRRWRKPAIWWGLASAFVALASRPLWLTAQRTVEDSGQQVRTFAEFTLYWIGWYVGPVTIVLAFVGLAWLLVKVINGKHRLALPFLGAFSATALLYLIRPSITADQVWATRRFLPIVIPGVILLAVWLLSVLYKKDSLRAFGKSVNARLAVKVLMVIALLSPVAISYPFLTVRNFSPQLEQVNSVCETVPDTALVLWLGESGKLSIQPTQTICGNESLGIRTPVTSGEWKEVAKIAADNQTRIVVGAFAEDLDALSANDRLAMERVSSADIIDIEHTYRRFPVKTITTPREVWLGELSTDGTIVNLGQEF
jgi:4-amino-4-deoxy-L-arabinose transferase-like glycosyltransferase